jgi:hypothetical protein
MQLQIIVTQRETAQRDYIFSRFWRFFCARNFAVYPGIFQGKQQCKPYLHFPYLA